MEISFGKIIWDAVKLYWWIILLLLLFIFAVNLLVIAIENIKDNLEKKKNDKKFSAINIFNSDKDIIEKLRKLKPAEFEDYIAFLFSELGFTTEKVGGSYDGGIDVIATKDGAKHYIQCKKYISSQVSVGAIRDFYGALTDKMANGKGYFITTNKFTLEAEKFAETKLIELIDGYKLLQYIKMAKMDNDEYFKKEIEVCPKCGGSLIERSGKYGKFFGCSNYPKCNFTKN